MKNTANLLQTILPLLASRKATVALALLALLSTLNYPLSTVLAQGTAFSYQGKLAVGTNAANGSYDLTFALFNANSAGSQAGNTTTNTGVGVTNGLFTVLLDFGNQFNGASRWLEIGVRTSGGGAFTTLSPRQALTPTPYAIMANSASNLLGTLAVAQVSGTVALAQLPAGVLTNNESGVVLTGTFSGSGTGLTNVGGGLTIQQNGDLTPNIIAGSPGNFVARGVEGATIAGGGTMRLVVPNGPPQPCTNSVIANCGAVGGGAGNSVTGSMGTVGGGQENTSWSLATVGGGYQNTASGTAAIVGGGNHNTASGMCAFVGGGGADGSFVRGNVASGTASVIGGGMNNVANAYSGTVGGGYGNTAGGGGWPPADYPTVGGGAGNSATNNYATVPGGAYNLAGGVYSFAAGQRAKALHQGSLVWADSQGGDFPSTANDQFLIRAAGGVGIGKANPTTALDVNGTVTATGLNVNGTAAVHMLQILGGSDVAEPFNISTKGIPKGAVVVIDDVHPGLVKMSDRSYDQRVAGIVSGANGINPGLTLRQEGVTEGGQNVALSGRVYALADAAYGPIKPGDLLTTSDTPGHSMRAGDHAKAQGAIIGKAMSALNTGRGMVLVLVSLQ